MNKWEFECNLGVKRVGYIQSVVETDVTYYMRDGTGELFVLSGSKVKTLKRIRTPEEGET